MLQIRSLRFDPQPQSPSLVLRARPVRGRRVLVDARPRCRWFRPSPSAIDREIELGPHEPTDPPRTLAQQGFPRLCTAGLFLLPVHIQGLDRAFAREDAALAPLGPRTR